MIQIVNNSAQILGFVLCCSAPGELTVVSTEPAAHTLTAWPQTEIVLHFDQPVDPTSVSDNTVWAFGRWSGAVLGSLSLGDSNHAVKLTPDQPLFPGEQVMVIVSHDLLSAAGAGLRPGGFSFTFWTAAGNAAREFSEIQTLSTRTVPGESSRAYGGIATDLNNDGWADLTIVNEDTADLRVFMNEADGTGRYAQFIQPTFPVNDRASPSEPADFNHDGFADICVANIDTHSVSVLLGNGDGTYGAQQEITVGSAPRGIAVLDVDGDGDVDIVNTNSASSNLSLLTNDGSGIFSAPSFFEGGGTGEWALASADMNDDGLLDLVVGARTSQTLIVNTANGDGTFTAETPQSAGGSVWMLVVGDVNGDGAEDVATANSSQNNGAIVTGNGDGTLDPPVTYATDVFPLATDIGDVDGDGDLDWVTSSFNGDWRLYLNNGAGLFAFDQEFDAPLAASCALMVDVDNDLDLDLALVDELEDVIIVLANSGIAVPGDVNGDGIVDINDLLDLLSAWGPCMGCQQDVDNDGEVSILDLLILLANWS